MINIIEASDSTIWFTSDWHLGHQRDFVWKVRGYQSADDHTNSIIETLNHYVRENDILFNLGDLCLNTTREQFDGYLDRIKCQNIWCLFGNHNNPHEKHIYRPERDKLTTQPVNWVYPVKYKNIAYIGHYHEVVVNGQFIVLFHYPLLSWNQMMHGSWALVGHEHGWLPSTRPDAKEGKILDLGWDLYKKPLSFAELKPIMDAKPISKIGHHVLH
jgi:calcineurin-like phosphoesterase family protein